MSELAERLITQNLKTKNPVLDLDGFEIDGTQVALKLIQHCTHGFGRAISKKSRLVKRSF